MSFPNRISRTDLGPTLEDVKPIVDPKKFIAANTWNELFWQLAGANLVIPRGIIVAQINVTGTTATTVFQGLAWDPDGALPNVEWTYVSSSEWTFVFPQSTYPDHSGQSQNLSLLFAGPAGGYQSDGTPLTVGAGLTSALGGKVTTTAAVSDGAKVGVLVY